MSDYLTRGNLVIEEAIRHQVQLGETASNYEVLMLQPGEYPFTLTQISGQPWVPGKNNAGYVKPGGPYYAKVVIDAIQIETYVVNRLFTATSSHHQHVHKPTKYTTRLYAYELYNRRTLFGSQAKIVLPDYWRENTYPVIERLPDEHYDRTLSMAIGWLKEHVGDDYTGGQHWHIWNRLNANHEGGVDGFVEQLYKDLVTS